MTNRVDDQPYYFLRVNLILCLVATALGCNACGCTGTQNTAQPGEEAKRLVAGLRAKIEGTKTIQVEFVTVREMNDKTSLIHGQVVIGEDDTAFIQLDGERNEEQVRAGLYSDGKRVRVWAGNTPRTDRFPKPDGLRANITKLLFEVGIELEDIGYLGGAYGTFDAHARFRLDDFAMSERTLIGDRHAVGIRYALKADFPAEIRCTLWLDERTGLPLQREVVYELGKPIGKVLTTFSQVKLDADIKWDSLRIPKGD